MKKLFIKILLLLLLPGITIATILFLIPQSKFYQKNLFYSFIDKNKNLKKPNDARLILIGGSNISFGINSKMLLDSLKIHPINTGIHAGIGLKFMLANAGNYIKENDIIIVAPEYQQFYGNLANGETELLSIILDVEPNSINLLDHKQYFSLFQAIPKYSNAKIYDLISLSYKSVKNGCYERNGFNAFGDAYKHWILPGEKVAPYGKLDGNINDEALMALIDFKLKAQKKQARVFFAFPGYQQSSFKNSATQIKALELILREKGIPLLSSPERYIIPDQLIFDTPYHLTKKGVDLRTALIIEDLKKVI